MKIGILECDDIAPQLKDKFVPYPEMFKTLLREVDESLSFHDFAVHKGEMPLSIDSCDAYLITGSKAGVYEPLDWIAALEGFIKALDREQRKLVGICFGHQLMSQVLGGTVGKSDKGWGVGLSVNQVVAKKYWMQPYSDHLDLLVSHQDQVIELPPGAEVLASSDFCPNYLIQYNDHFMSVQGHPEFSKALSRALMDLRRGDVVPEERVVEGIESLAGESQGLLMMQWLVNFLRDS